MPKIKEKDIKHKGKKARKMEIYNLLYNPGINVSKITQKNEMI